MNSSAAGGFNMFAQTASLSMLQAMQAAAAAAAAGSMRPTGMPSYYLHGGAMPQLRLPQTNATTTGSILNARLLGAAPQPPPQPPQPAPAPLSDTRPVLTPIRQHEADRRHSHHQHQRHNHQAQKQRELSLASASQTGELVETTLEGRTIFAFDVGGEKRLCLPQVLNKVLLCAGATLADINRVCEDLNIFCDRCNDQQMAVLMERKVFGPVLESCGLITKSNAERLCKALLNSEMPKFQGSLTGEDGISVYHNCFGKQRGFLVPRMYTSPDAPCIVCNGCSTLMSPTQFVGHAHSRPERDTCHWGFDSTKWRLYLLLDKRLTDSAADGCLADSERACLEKVLDGVKAKFDRKRSQTSTGAAGGNCPEPAKRCKTETPVGDSAPASVVPKFLAPLPPAVTSGCSSVKVPTVPQQLKQVASAVQLLSNQQHQDSSAAAAATAAPQSQKGSESQHHHHHRDYTPNVRLAPTPRTGKAAESTGSPASIEEVIAADWESLTDWGEGHLPEKATPQFLAMVEKVKSGYRAHTDCLSMQLGRLRAQVARSEQLESEASRLRRQLEEQGSPDVRKLRMKYTAQKEELQQLKAERARLQLALSAAANRDDDEEEATADAEAGQHCCSPPALEMQQQQKLES